MPADKSALISKGAHHLLFKRCVGPYLALVKRRGADLLCLELLGVPPRVVRLLREDGGRFDIATERQRCTLWYAYTLV